MALNGEYSLSKIRSILASAFGYSGDTSPTYVGMRVAPLVRVGSHTTLTVNNSVQTLIPPTGANKLIIQSIGADVRLTFDGTSPSTTVGFLIKDSIVPLVLDVPTGSIKLIRAASTDASVAYQWASQ